MYVKINFGGLESANLNDVHKLLQIDHAYQIVSHLLVYALFSKNVIVYTLIRIYSYYTFNDFHQSY